MSISEEKVFEVEDLRKYIFSFLRDKPEKVCVMCNDTLIWDKKERKRVIEVSNLVNKNIIPGVYCVDCYYRFNHFSCVLC